MQEKVLIIAPEDAAKSVSHALSRELDVAVAIAGSRRAGRLALRNAEWSLVVLEESLGGNDAAAAELLYVNAGNVPILEMNFAITSAARAVRQVRAALARRAFDRAQARAVVTATLQGELRSTLTGLLLETELALQDATPLTGGKASAGR